MFELVYSYKYGIVMMCTRPTSEKCQKYKKAKIKAKKSQNESQKKIA